MKLFPGILITALIYSMPTLADLSLITWKGIYYAGAPIKKGVSNAYCQEHTPGVFTHVVKDALQHPMITNKNITLADAHFTMDKIDGVYLIYGDFIATGFSAHKKWHDHIYYYLYKFSEGGVTKGVWYTKDCKGLYKGIAIKNNNIKPKNI